MSKRPSRTARRVSSWLVVAAILIIASVSGIRLHWNDILSNATGTVAIPEGSTSVYFIDVGQGDCELIRTPDGQNILIDAGTNATGDKLVQYLEQLGVETSTCQRWRTAKRPPRAPTSAFWTRLRTKAFRSRPAAAG